MNIYKLKLNLAKHVKKHKQVTFVEIEQFFENNRFNYKGDKEICTDDRKIVIWGGWNVLAIKIMHDLTKSKIIEMNEAELLNYLFDGKVLKYPVYQGVRNYKQWIPVEFN